MAKIGIYNKKAAGKDLPTAFCNNIIKFYFFFGFIITSMKLL